MLQRSYSLLEVNDLLMHHQQVGGSLQDRWKFHISIVDQILGLFLLLLISCPVAHGFERLLCVVEVTGDVVHVEGSRQLHNNSVSNTIAQFGKGFTHFHLLELGSVRSQDEVESVTEERDARQLPSIQHRHGLV